LDFGIAKIQQPAGQPDSDITAANLVIGTPQYMSPERCSQSGPLDPRSDIYSLGIIVFEMLAGRVPFTGESPTVIMMKQVQDEPPSVLEFRPDLPPAVAAVIARALAKKPEDRFQTAGELASAVTAAAASNDEAQVAVPVTVPNAPVAPLDDDEVTIVRPRPVDEVTVVQPRSHSEAVPHVLTETVEPPLDRGFNPWRIMVPAAVGLVVLFGLLFLLTRGSSDSQSGIANVNVNANQTGLAADPNSQAVQPVGPATGEGEKDVQAQPSPSTTPTPRNSNVNSAPATVVGEFGTNENANSSPRQRNANVRPTPAPRSTDEPPPPPRPTPSLTDVVKPVRARPTPTP